MRVYFHKYFDKRFAKLPQKVQQKAKEKIGIFTADPFNEALHNHVLTGNREGLRSINITGDFRAIYDPISETDAVFVDIGTHSQLYG